MRDNLILNVTPAEFSAIKEIELNCVDLFTGKFHEQEFRRRLEMRLAVSLTGHAYRVVVRRDVPAIPWWTPGVYRVEPPAAVAAGDFTSKWCS